MAKPRKQSRAPVKQERCHACKQLVWSMALHNFCCPVMFPDLSQEQKDAWEKIERQTQRAAGLDPDAK